MILKTSRSEVSMKSLIAAISFAAVLLLATACGGDGEQPDTTQGKIAFRSESEGNSEIYVMDADGSSQTNLTSDPAGDETPAWSPDGSRIAFTSDREGNFEIYVMDADGSDLTRLTNDPAADGTPAWSPDGSRIAFTSDRDGNFEIYVMDADGSGQTNLTNNAARDGTPTWSPVP